MQRIQRVSPNLFINAHQEKDLQRKYLMRPSSVNRSIIRHWNYSKTVIEAVEESRIQGLTGCNTQQFSSKWYDNEIISINSYYYHLDEMKGNGEGWIQNLASNNAGQLFEVELDIGVCLCCTGSGLVCTYRVT